MLALGDLFLLLGCLDVKVFVLSYFILSFWLLSLRSLSFSIEREDEMDPEGRNGGEELAGVKGGGTIIRIYCMGKK